MYQERMNDMDGLEPVPCQPWTSRLPKMAQPDLDYIEWGYQRRKVTSGFYMRNDSAVHALQFLDVINMKDPTQKAHFYRNTLKEVLPYIPRKLWYQHVWPCLQQEMKAQEVLAAVLQPIIYLATVTLLENLHIVLEKTPRDDIRAEVLPMLYNAFESTTLQVQYLDEAAIRRMVLPKTKLVYEKNSGDLKIVLNVLLCLERTLDRLDRSMIIDEVLPLLWDVRLSDPEITLRVVNIYRLMLSDKKFGLSVNLMATRVMPSLLPQTVNPSLNLEQFTSLLEVLQEMLDHID
ncbi:hypothetical protein B566_EDAN002056, partial [Ephemera danica]